MDLQLSDMFFGNRTSAWKHRGSQKNDNYIANDEYITNYLDVEEAYATALN